MIKINLLPPEKRKKARRAAPAKKKEAGKPPLSGLRLPALKWDPVVAVPAAAAVLAVLFVAGSYFWLGYREDAVKQQRDDLRVELNKLNRTIVRMDELKENTREVTRRMEVISEVDRNRFIWPRILDDVSTALPRYTWLQTVDELTPFPQLRMRIEGQTMSNILLSELLANLDASETLTEVSLVSSAERRQQNYDIKHFIIECESSFNQPPDTTGQMARANQ